MTEEIIVDIHPDGKITMEAKGFHGKGCEVVLEELGAALGKTTNVRLKPEYHERVTHGEKVRGR
jgi:hypothetical protein